MKEGRGKGKREGEGWEGGREGGRVKGGRGEGREGEGREGRVNGEEGREVS